MSTALRIKDWSDNFQLSQNTRIGRWGRLPIPIRLDSEHYRTLMMTPKGREAYAVFIALAAVAANMPVRGVLAKEDGPLSEAALHIRTGIPTKALSVAIATLSSKEVGWLEETEFTPSTRGVRTELEPIKVGSSLSIALTEPEAKHNPPAGTPGANGSKRFLWSEVQPIVAAYPPHRRCGQGDAVRAIQRALAESEIPEGSDPLPWLLGRVQAYAASWAATRESGKFVLGFVKWLDSGCFLQPDTEWAEPQNQNGHAAADIHAIVERAAANAAKKTRSRP